MQSMEHTVQVLQRPRRGWYQSGLLPKLHQQSMPLCIALHILSKSWVATHSELSLMLPLPGWRFVTQRQTEQIPLVLVNASIESILVPFLQNWHTGDRVWWYGVVAGFVKHVSARRSLENCTPCSGCDRDAWHQGQLAEPKCGQFEEKTRNPFLQFHVCFHGE